jgi:hypothetical protein
MNMDNFNQTEFWIHFNTQTELSNFLKVYKYRIGDKCCDKTGVLLPGVKSKKELDKIKDCFLKKLKHPSLRKSS